MAADLERAEKLRRNMVADVAHELRTPLSNVAGYLEAIRDDVVKPDKETIASLSEEADLLSRLVNDLQELALADAGELKLLPPGGGFSAAHSTIRQGHPGPGRSPGIDLIHRNPGEFTAGQYRLPAD